jgi:hypothetical protein
MNHTAEGVQTKLANNCRRHFRNHLTRMTSNNCRTQNFIRSLLVEDFDKPFLFTICDRAVYIA